MGGAGAGAGAAAAAATRRNSPNLLKDVKKALDAIMENNEDYFDPDAENTYLNFLEYLDEESPEMKDESELVSITFMEHHKYTIWLKKEGKEYEEGGFFPTGETIELVIQRGEIYARRGSRGKHTKINLTSARSARSSRSSSRGSRGSRGSRNRSSPRSRRNRRH
jgi:hypothetical protein